MAIHTMPVGDTRDGEPFEHAEETTCACGPSVSFVDGEMLVVHNSFDGREAVEWADAVLDSQAPPALSGVAPVEPGSNLVSRLRDAAVEVSRLAESADADARAALWRSEIAMLEAAEQLSRAA